VGLTTPSVNERIKKMSATDDQGFVALLDHEKMGFRSPPTSNVALEHPASRRASSTTSRRLLGVQECHYLAAISPIASR